MSLASLLAQGRFCGLFALGAASAGAWALDCAAPQPSAVVGVERSRWQEFNSQGRRVVDETGVLHRAGLRLDGDCSALQWAAQWSQARGTRDYDGVSSTNQPLQTHSRLQTTQAQLALWSPWNEDLALGARLDWTQVDRAIASVGRVQGYPERFRYLQAALGARYRLADLGGLQWTVQGWLGGGPGGQLRLSLPGADVARLDLGRSQWAQLELQLQPAVLPSPLPGWNWQLRLQWQQEQMHAGTSQAITRNGLLVGGAVQPQTRQTRTGIEAGLQYRF